MHSLRDAPFEEPKSLVEPHFIKIGNRPDCLMWNCFLPVQRPNNKRTEAGCFGPLVRGGYGAGYAPCGPEVYEDGGGSLGALLVEIL